jgi:peroxin-7
MSLNTFHGHSKLVYNAMWSPLVPSCFASVAGTFDMTIRLDGEIFKIVTYENKILFSGDGLLKIWSSNLPRRPPLTLHVHDAEVLTCSWCKFNENLIATGASDGLIRGWDLRFYSAPIFEQTVSFHQGNRITVPFEYS